MKTTRRLSLTWLLLAPLIRAQDGQTVDTDLSLSSVTGDHLPQSQRPHKVEEAEYDDQEEVFSSSTTTKTAGCCTDLQTGEEDEGVRELLGGQREGYTNTEKAVELITTATKTEGVRIGQVSGVESERATEHTLVRQRRESSLSAEHLGDGDAEDGSDNIKKDVNGVTTTTETVKLSSAQTGGVKSDELTEHTPGDQMRYSKEDSDDMETAEQVVFRPYFRPLDRKQALQETQRRQSLQQVVTLASGQVQPFWQLYPYQYNYYHALSAHPGVVRPHRSVVPSFFYLFKQL